MRYSVCLRLGVASLLLAVPSIATGQQLPTVDQAKHLLQTRPDLVALLRQKIVTSGMTADQIRARLQAAGYPSNLLDAYLSGGADSTARPNATVFSAVSAL